MSTNMGQTLAQPGGPGSAIASARAGYLPICIARAPLAAFRGIPVYLRSTVTGGQEAFTLYCSEHVRLTEGTRERLAQAEVKFVYIPIAQQAQFRQQTEAELERIVHDDQIATSVAAEIVYETSIELVNELLRDPDLASQSPRLQNVARAVTTLVLKDPSAFSHLFATSHHDFYTATHMVNVGTWMVPLAYEMGIRDETELNEICHAGILHDIGKLQIPAEILNKKGRLTPHELAIIRSHPELGCDYLRQIPGIPELVHTVTRQHHERLDGSGYPDRLRGEQITLASRICAVADSFDAMTALRPYKDRTMSLSQAGNVILAETPAHYDGKVVSTWIGMLRSAERNGVLSEKLTLSDTSGAPVVNRRQTPRFSIDCPGRAQIVPANADVAEPPAVHIKAHSISRSGIGFLSRTRIRPGDFVRVQLMGNGTLDRAAEGLTIRCRGYGDGWYEIGMEFADLVSLAPSVPAKVA